ncbi:hypothetical protein A2U01_0007676, partial [Trifolium medium]|nr:hypothetical protein [Trifolium medium]
RQAPQFATQASIPANNIFSSIIACPDRNHQTPPLHDAYPQNTAENHIPNQPRRASQEQQINDMFSTMFTLFQQQTARLSYVEQNQQTVPQMVNNHAQNSLCNVLQDEVSSQQRRTGQRGPQTEAIINTNGNNAQVNNETGIVEPNGTKNTNDQGNGNRENNGNGRQGRNSPNPNSSDNGSSGDYPYEDGRRREPNRHPGRTPFTLKILETRIPRTLKKPPKLEIYDGTTDQDEHLKYIDTVLDYYQSQGAKKCRLFVLTLKGAAMTWFKGLEDDSIDSWRELCKAFSSHFIARKRQPKTMASLSNIVQGREESLRDYIERFTREAIEIKGAYDKLECYIFEKGLRNDTKFKEKPGLKEPRDMQDLLSCAQNYINYEEKMLGEKPEKAKIQPRKYERTREERGRRIPRGGYPEYTPLNTSREKILQDCLNTEF